MERLEKCPFCGAEWKPLGSKGSLVLYHEPQCFFWCIGRLALQYDPGREKYRSKWNKRAERTCKIHPTTIDNRRHISTIREYECLSCEGLIAVYACDEKPRYCPHCGAKAVE